MLFAIYAHDKPNSSEMRLRLRPSHKAYLKLAEEKIAFAGPLLGDDGQSVSGSLLVMEFPDRNALDRWFADEPFTREGLFKSFAVHPFENYWPQRVGFPAA